MNEQAAAPIAQEAPAAGRAVMPADASSGTTRRRRLDISTPAAQGIALFAAIVAVVAFFLPWMDGDGTFALRTFSGFDFARLIRNFEITAGSQPDTAQIRATAIAFYLSPALIVNAAVIFRFASLLGVGRSVTGTALALASTYTLVLVLVLLAMSFVPGSRLDPHVGMPREGIVLTAAAATVIGWLALREVRQPAGA